MKIHGVISVALLFLPSLVSAAENMSAVELARNGNEQFHQGEYKKAERFLEKAVKLDSTNARYRQALGETYEREAEQASFPLVLTSKARSSFVRALELEPESSAALIGLIELEQTPIGLCEGDLTEAGQLIGRLEQVDALAARREKLYWEDARREASEPGQRFLCGPVKVSRVVTSRVLPLTPVKRASSAPAVPGEVSVAQAKHEEISRGQ